MGNQIAKLQNSSINKSSCKL